MIDALQRLVSQIDNEPQLLDPHHLRQRMAALDRLDAYFPDAPPPPTGAAAELYRRAREITAKLEAANHDLYEAIRGEIQRGRRPEALLRYAHSLPEANVAAPAVGMAYDHLDALLSGVFQFEQPAPEHVRRDSEMVFYQPTPARHIFRLIALTALNANDVLVDLGAGLGHVPILASICTPARTIGIELEPAYIERARECAHRLNLKHVTFIEQDARTADLSTGTVFYLYTPFTGSILRSVLDRLSHQAANRKVRICTYGPCTPVVAGESWLNPAATPQPHQITLFTSSN